jgi:signal transduction histidine kinase
MPVDDDSGLRVSRAAYRLETVAVLRQRLSVAMGLFVFFMGIGTFLEVTLDPARARFALLLYGLEALLAIVGAGVCWIPGMAARSGTIAALTAVVLAACINTYHAQVGAQAERVATVLGCILNLLSVLLPWGWVGQGIAFLGTLGSFALAGPHLVTQDALAFPAIVLVAAGTTSVCGAFFLDRYRFEAFRRTALQTEEAEIAAALAHVGQTLSKHLGVADILERVNRLTVDAVGCDWSSLFIFDEHRGVYRLASNVGSRPEVVSDLTPLEFPPDSLPLLQALRPGELVAITNPDEQDLVPPELLRRLGVASALYAPVSRREDIIGILVIGVGARVGAFSRRERRLTLRIAHATAITLENGRLIADLQAANHLKSEFVATMSHELRTPINVIMGYTEMLADGVFKPHEPEWSGTITRIQEHAVELLDLVSATLDMGRLESGRDIVSITDVDVARLLAGLRRELKPLIPQGVLLTWQNDLGDDRILTDAVKLKTILKNLVGNALKFTSAGFVDVIVHVTSRSDTEEDVVFIVRDTGIGIPPEHLPVIFEMFRQVDSSSTRRFSGVGLGLHIAQRLVQLLGGTIAVESTPDVGSTFTVTLPLRRAAVVAPVPEPRRAAQ